MLLTRRRAMVFGSLGVREKFTLGIGVTSATTFLFWNLFCEVGLPQRPIRAESPGERHW